MYCLGQVGQIQQLTFIDQDVVWDYEHCYDDANFGQAME